MAATIGPAARQPALGLPRPAHLAAAPESPIPAVNVASVPQRSPLRYPGGKTWLVPHIRAWLGGLDSPPPLLLEPFAGGGIVSLTAVMEGLARRCRMVELDPDVAAFWRAALEHGPELRRRVAAFEPSRGAIEALARSGPDGPIDRGFRTLVLNRARRGGILAPGASLARNGENGKGVASRWYPETLCRRLLEIERHADRIEFRESDGLDELESAGSGTVAFVDPPYNAGGKRAGRRLYAHNEIDHRRLFELLHDGGLDFLLTYDAADEILALVRRHGFQAVAVQMKNTHHDRIQELVITRRPVFTRRVSNFASGSGMAAVSAICRLASAADLR